MKKGMTFGVKVEKMRRMVLSLEESEGCTKRNDPSFLQTFSNTSSSLIIGSVPSNQKENMVRKQMDLERRIEEREREREYMMRRKMGDQNRQVNEAEREEWINYSLQRLSNGRTKRQQGNSISTRKVIKPAKKLFLLLITNMMKMEKRVLSLKVASKEEG